MPKRLEKYKKERYKMDRYDEPINVADVKFRDREFEKFDSRQKYERLVCKKRKERQASLFAFNHIGKGKGSGKKRNYNDRSKVRC